jgi:hypothetical protein
MKEREKETPRRTPRMKLESQSDIRRELTRVYKQAIKGDLAWSDASKVANFLQILGRFIEASEKEKQDRTFKAMFPPIGEGLTRVVP